MSLISSLGVQCTYASADSVSVAAASAAKTSRGFADFLSDLLNPDTSETAGTATSQTHEDPMASLGARLDKLISFAEKMMDRILDRLNLSAPEGFEVKQTSASSRLEITGISAHKDTLENAVNNDGFFCQAFEAVRIQYTEMRSFTVGPKTPDAGFSLAYDSGDLRLKAPDLSGLMADSLMKELERKEDRLA
ncbi:MAG: hypothetical protein V1913_04510 [Fibrobacterota bacterium]